jgi:hypothetical protein
MLAGVPLAHVRCLAARCVGGPARRSVRRRPADLSLHAVRTRLALRSCLRSAARRPRRSRFRALGFKGWSPGCARVQGATSPSLAKAAPLLGFRPPGSSPRGSCRGFRRWLPSRSWPNRTGRCRSLRVSIDPRRDGSLCRQPDPEVRSACWAARVRGQGVSQCRTVPPSWDSRPRADPTARSIGAGALAGTRPRTRAMAGGWLSGHR